MAVLDAKDPRPLRPGIVRSPRVGRSRQKLEVHQAATTVSHGRTDAIGAGIAAADDHHVPVRCRDVSTVFVVRIEKALCALEQILHCEVDASQLATGNRQISRLRRAAGEEQRVVLLAQLLDIDVDADVSIRDELHALFAQQVQATLDHGLVEFHIGDAVHQESADTVIALINRRQVPRFVQLRRCGQARGPRPDDRHRLTGARPRRLGSHPSLGEAAVDDGVFDVLDGHRGIGDPQHARPLTGSGAGAPRELGKVVRLVQTVERLAPLTVVDEIIPLGDQVIDRAARPGLAKRHAAVHAACSLPLQVFVGHCDK